MVEDSATDAELALRTFQRAAIANPLAVLSSSEKALAYLSGTGAYAKRGPTQPLLILLDLQLPGMSGLDFLSQLKTNERTWVIPVVSLSMTRSAPAIAMWLQRGVVDRHIRAGFIAAARTGTGSQIRPTTVGHSRFGRSRSGSPRVRDDAAGRERHCPVDKA